MEFMLTMEARRDLDLNRDSHGCKPTSSTSTSTTVPHPYVVIVQLQALLTTLT